MTANITLGGPLTDLINSVNIFGTGGDLVLMGLALIIALAVCQKEVANERYTNTFGVFTMTMLGYYAAGVMTSTVLFSAAVIIGCIGIVISEGTKQYRS